MPALKFFPYRTMYQVLSAKLAGAARIAEKFLEFQHRRLYGKR